MDIYEFSQALRRQWKLLLIGFLSLIVGVFAAIFEVSRVDGSLSFESRITPKYESSVEMVVVPAGLESLASRAVAGGSDAAAQVYVQMLSTPEAARQVEETQGIELIDTLAAKAADSFISVTAISNTPDGATAGALGAFRWLERRLAEPPVIAQLPEQEPDPVPEEFLGSLLVEVDRLYVTADPGLTLVIANFQGDEVATSLQAAAGDVEPQLIYLKPESTLSLSVERQVGVPLDTVRMAVPPLLDIEEAPPPLVLAVEWGAVDFDEIEVEGEDESPAVTTDPEDAPGARIDSTRLSLSWNSTIATIAAPDDRVSLLLITEDVIALETGQRRTPVMVLALLGVGALLLLVLATTVDTWQMAKLEGRMAREREETVSLESKRQGLHLAPPETDTSAPPERTDESGRGRWRRSSRS